MRLGLGLGLLEPCFVEFNYFERILMAVHLRLQLGLGLRLRLRLGRLSSITVAVRAKVKVKARPCMFDYSWG